VTTDDLHRSARPFVLSALAADNIAAQLSVVQSVQAVGYLETGYGKFWKGAGVGSKNWGATQRGRPPCDPANSFLYTDTHPTDTGGSVTYSVCFNKFATDDLGAKNLVDEVYEKRPKVLDAARSGSLPNVSKELFLARYYEGFGSTPAERIAHHYKALFSSAVAIAHALGEPAPPPQGLVTEPWHHDPLDPYPIIKRGSNQHAIVETLQMELDEEIRAGRLHEDMLAVDGQFGPHTEHAVAAFQAVQHLKIDGIVGEATWSKLFELGP